jgi:hypothetical protein
VLPVISAFMSRGVPEGEPVVLDVAQLGALLSRTFGIGLDVGRGKEPESGTNWGRRLRLADGRGLALISPGVNPVPPATRHVHLPRFVPLSR